MISDLYESRHGIQSSWKATLPSRQCDSWIQSLLWMCVLSESPPGRSSFVVELRVNFKSSQCTLTVTPLCR